MADLLIKLNNKCNANCLFCEIPRYKKNQEEPPLQDKLKELAEGRKNFDSVIITGGEPAIYPEIFKFVRYAREKCEYKQITIESNGLVFYYPKIIDRLIESGIDRFQVSFQTTDKKVYDKITNIKNSYNYAIKGIENIKKRGKFLHINTVIHKYNYRNLPDIVRTLANKKADSIQLSFVNPIGSNIKDGRAIAGIEYSKTLPYVKEAINAAEKLGFKPLFIRNYPICIAKDFLGKLEISHSRREKSGNKDQAKEKPEKCGQCIYYSSCEGVWKAYLEQFGDEELSPIKLKNGILDKNGPKVPDDFLKEKSPLFNKYIFEIAGMELGIKKASVFYLKKNEIPGYTEELKNHGYYYEVSDFSYLTKNETTEKINGETEDGDYSLYVSEDREICKRLKYLDYYHQFKAKEPSGIDSREIFFEIGEILGYPKCCSEFLLSCHDNQNYENLFAESNRAYQDETIYKILALRNSPIVLHQLNNFSISYPSFFNFFVCRYGCRNAASIADRLLGYTKQKYPSEYESFIRNLKMPIIFFSAHRIIYFQNTVKKDGLVHYTGCFVRKELLQNLGKERTDEFARRFMMLSEGDSFRMDDDKILIYKNDKIIHLIRKEHKDDGIFIEFS